MKAQTSIQSATPICPENCKFQQHHLTSRGDYSWAICCMRVCKYSLERCRSYLQLLCSIFFLNLYRLRSALSLAMTAHSGLILSQKGKTEPKDLPLWNSAQSEKIMSHTLFLIQLFLSSVPEWNLILPLELNLFPGFCWILRFDLAFRSV
jgi:hypothetical protein